MNYHRVCPVCHFQYDDVNRCLCDRRADRFVMRYIIPLGFLAAIFALLFGFLGDNHVGNN